MFYLAPSQYHRKVTVLKKCINHDLTVTNVCLNFCNKYRMKITD